MDQDTLLTRLKAGDETAFSDIYKAFFLQMVHVAALQLGGYGRAPDAVQEVFYTLYKNKTLLGVNTSVEGYIRTAVIFKCRKFLKTSPPRSSELNDELYEIIDTPYREAALPNIDFLTKKQKKVIQGIYSDGKKPKALAKEMGSSISTINVHVFNALKQIRERFTWEDFFKTKTELTS